MTSDLRDRMAAELDELEPLGDLVGNTISTGRTKLRRRKAVLGSLVATAAVVVGATWAVGVGADGRGKGPSFVADQPGAPAVPTIGSDPREQWAQQTAQLFAAHLPAGFAAGVRQTGGDDQNKEALQFIASGPRGQVQLNALVYPGSGLPTPDCEATKASQCRVISTPAGTITVLKNMYMVGPDQSDASEIWVDGDGVQTIINLVEVRPGDSQFSMRDLRALASDSRLDQAVNFALEHTGELKDIAVVGR